MFADNPVMQGEKGKRKTGLALFGWWFGDDDKDGRCVWSDGGLCPDCLSSD